MIEKLIKDSLLTDKTVIIPTLGTLTLTNSETMEVMFLSYLKFDDKKLTTDYATINDCTYAEAKDILYSWVEKLIEDIQNGRKRNISDVGYFQFTREDEIEFVSGETIDLTDKTVVAQKEKVITEEETKENSEIKEVIEEQREVEEAILITPEKEEEEDVLVEESIEENREEIVEEKTIKQVKKKSSSRSKIPVIILLAVLLIGGILGAVFYSKIFPQKKEIVANKVSSSTEELAPNESNTSSKESIVIASDTTLVEEENTSSVTDEPQENNITNPTQTMPSSAMTGSYCVIVGAFQELSNADRLVNQLKSNEYNAEIINKNGFNMVSIASYSTMEEAISKTQELKSAWVLKK